MKSKGIAHLVLVTVSLLTIALVVRTSAKSEEVGPSHFAGGSHNCVMTVNSYEDVFDEEGDSSPHTSNPMVRCFGWNYLGQLGYVRERKSKGSCEKDQDISFVDLGDGFVRSVHSGFAFSCAIVAVQNPDSFGGNHLVNKVKCWGGNMSGQLGLGIDAQILEEADNDFRKMGNNLPFVDLGLEGDEEVVDLALGRYHVLALTNKGRVKGWGSNFYGQLGIFLDKTDTFSANWELNEDKYGTSPNDMGENLPFLDTSWMVSDLDMKIVQITAGAKSSCVLFDDYRTMACFGRNDVGQLGSGKTYTPYDKARINRAPHYVSSIKKIVSSDFNHGFISYEGNLYLWGGNMNGELGQNHRNAIWSHDPLQKVQFEDELKVLDYQGGDEFGCALLSNHKMKCWGANDVGQLGIESKEVSVLLSKDLPFMKLSDDVVKSIHVGEGHTCAVLSDNSLKCWGDNYDGEIGQCKCFDEPPEEGCVENIGRNEADMTNLDAIDFGITQQIYSSGDKPTNGKSVSSSPPIIKTSIPDTIFETEDSKTIQHLYEKYTSSKFSTNNKQRVVKNVLNSYEKWIHKESTTQEVIKDTMMDIMLKDSIFRNGMFKGWIFKLGCMFIVVFILRRIFRKRILPSIRKWRKNIRKSIFEISLIPNEYNNHNTDNIDYSNDDLQNERVEDEQRGREDQKKQKRKMLRELLNKSYDEDSKSAEIERIQNLIDEIEELIFDIKVNHFYKLSSSNEKDYFQMKQFFEQIKADQDDNPILSWMIDEEELTNYKSKLLNMIS